MWDAMHIFFALCTYVCVQINLSSPEGQTLTHVQGGLHSCCRCTCFRWQWGREHDKAASQPQLSLLLYVQPQKQLFWPHIMSVIVYYTQEVLRRIHFCPRRKFAFTGACSHAGYRAWAGMRAQKLFGSPQNGIIWQDLYGNKSINNVQV